MRRAIALLCVCGVTAALGCASAADLATVRLGVPPKDAPGVRRGPDVPTGYVVETKAAPTIDGKVDEAVWQRAAALTLGTMTGRGKTKTRTEVFLLHDRDHFYVAYKMEEPNVATLVKKVTERDGPCYGDDDIEIFISKRGDDRFYQFVVGAGGALLDAYRRDKKWNCKTQHAIHIGKNDWSVELAIPLASVGGIPRKTRPWRVNFYRGRRAHGSWEGNGWSPPMRGFDVPNRFGILIFGDPPKPKALDKTAAPNLPKLLDAANGQAVIQFDLSAVPKGAKVHRAELRLFREVLVTGADKEALVDIEIYPLNTAFEDGGQAKAVGRPLPLLGPAYQSFDATDPVQQWVKGKTNGGFFIKVCPLLNAANTCLDIAYQGTPKNVPPPATGVKALHRAGQTFITWNEVAPLIKTETTTWGEIKQVLKDHRDALRYRIVTADKPITPANLAAARLLGEVGPLSAYNTNERNKEYLIGQAMAKSDEIGELARNFNGFMHTWHINSTRMNRYPVKRFVIDKKAGPLPVGTGLYVHQPAKPGTRYYAVISVQNGVESTLKVSSSKAVKEQVGTGVPVRQGKGLWGPYFDFPGTRWTYVQWCAPPLAPQPNMYFNWSVLEPKNGKTKAPCELYFHPGGYSHAQPGKKLLWNSYQLATYDLPGSGWYGFNDAYGTLKAFTKGTVRNHTQRRIIAFLDWAKKTFPIDEDQVISVGADGAAALALSYPEQFAYVRITGFNRSSVLSSKALKGYSRIWGPPIADIKDDQGRSKWEWAYLDALAIASKKDLPVFACYGGSWGSDKGYAKGNGRFYRAMQKARQSLIAHWGWSGARNLGTVNRYTGAWRGLVITRNMPVPAFSNSTRDTDREAGGTAGGGYGWSGIKETANSFEIRVHAGGGSTFDFTPRRLQTFKIKPNEKLKWTAVTIPGRRGEKGEPQAGELTADASGLVTIEKIKSTPRSGGLIIKITRAN